MNFHPVAQGRLCSIVFGSENEVKYLDASILGRYFEILELNPFPFVKAPYEVGNQWEWELEINI